MPSGTEIEHGALVGHDDGVDAGLHGQGSILLVEHALEDQLAAPALPDPLHVLP
jgi:hypothetical protein